MKPHRASPSVRAALLVALAGYAAACARVPDDFLDGGDARPDGARGDAPPPRDAPPAEPDAALPADDAAPTEPDAEPPLDATEPPLDATEPLPDVPAIEPDAALPDTGTPPGDDPANPRTVRYPPDQTQSPLTAALVARLRARAAMMPARAGDVFAKTGASNTVNTNFFTCFAGSNVDLAGRDELRPTMEHFRGGNAAGTTPYQRVSLAATVGWSASAALAGSPPPIDREVAAVNPRYALVMFGTNDIQSNDPYRYAENMFSLTDRLLAAGVLPVLTSVPPRDDSATADAWVPRFNAVARGVAQARGVPFVDLERELRTIAGHGLVSDGIHLNVYAPGGAARGCVLTAAGLNFGQNRRNLLTLEALHRLRTALAPDAPPPTRDAAAPFLAGRGTAAEPYEIDEAHLPFADARDTSREGEARLNRYTGCMAAQDESGREVVYRLTLRRPARLRAFVASRTGVDVDVHVLGASASEGACVERNDRVIVRDFAAGTHFLTLDSFVPATTPGMPREGEYLFVLVRE